MSLLIPSNPLIWALTHQISNGIKRKSATTCSRWAELHRNVTVATKTGTITKKFDFTRHPWSRAMHDETKSWRALKAAQMAVTETALNVALYNIDVFGRSVLYLLPKRNPDATDFSKSRFDPAIEESEHLRKLFSDTNNIGHKQAGSASLYIRGSRSKSAVKSLPVGLFIGDEYDEMVLKHIAQALERLSGQDNKQSILFSTPTIPDFGIDAEFKNTTQDHYFFRCPNCSKFTEFVFPESLIVTGESQNDPNLRQSYLQTECKHPIIHEAKKDIYKSAIWKPTDNLDSDIRGFYINQFYSFFVNPYELAQVAIKAEDDLSTEQEWWNSKGGLPHLTEGSRIQIENVTACMGNFSMNDAPPPPGSLITLGVDQGKKIYYEIDQWFIDAPGDVNANSRCKVLKQGIVHKFEELDRLMYEYQPHMCVIDIHPERRKAEEFMRRFYGSVKLCFYPNGIDGKSINQNDAEQTIKVDRSSWLDLSIGRFRSKKILLPKDLTPNYKDHIHNLVRRYEQDKMGNPVIRYINLGADHFGHARNYAEIALPLAMASQTNTNVDSFL